MSETTFKSIEEEVETKKEADAATGTSLATTEGGTTDLSTEVQESGFASEDINIDHIQVFGKSSHFNPEGGSIGDICYNKETPLVSVNEKLQVVIVHTRKYWKENVPYDEDGATPRFANTLAEKAKIEATTEYKGTVPVCDLTVLIKRPTTFTDDDAAASIFQYEFGGEEWALAKYTVQKAQAVRENYGTYNVAKRARGTKGESIDNYLFELSSKEKGSGSRFSWHQFILRGSSARVPEGALDFVRSLRGE